MTDTHRDELLAAYAKIEKLEAENQKLKKPIGVVCPFCSDDDFDLSGLKGHLERWCAEYKKLKVGASLSEALDQQFDPLEQALIEEHYSKE